MVLPKKSKSVSAVSPSRPQPRLFTLYDPPPQESIDFTVLDEETGEYVPEPSLTQQSDMDGADLNKLLARYERTGELPDMIKGDPTYGDFSDMPSYQEGLNIVARAQEQFSALHAHVRKKFDNDPAKFLDFVSKPENKEEMGKLGLLKPEVVLEMRKAKGLPNPLTGVPDEPTGGSSPGAKPPGSSAPVASPQGTSSGSRGGSTS